MNEDDSCGKQAAELEETKKRMGHLKKQKQN